MIARIKKIGYYTKIYSGGVTDFKDDEIFKVCVPLIKSKFTEKFTENERKILEEIIKKEDITQEKLAEIIGISRRSVINNINKLREKKIITRVGSDRKGYWKIALFKW